jgi:hypothetical protein
MLGSTLFFRFVWLLIFRFHSTIMLPLEKGHTKSDANQRRYMRG